MAAISFMLIGVLLVLQANVCFVEGSVPRSNVVKSIRIRLPKVHRLSQCCWHYRASSCVFNGSTKLQRTISSMSLRNMAVQTEPGSLARAVPDSPCNHPYFQSPKGIHSTSTLVGKQTRLTSCSIPVGMTFSASSTRHTWNRWNATTLHSTLAGTFQHRVCTSV